MLKYSKMPDMLTTLIELQRLKRLERTGWNLRGLPNGTESVAAHSFGVGVTAMLLADELVRQGVPIDVEKVIRIALLHDWSEARVGDMPRTATEYFGTEARRRAEMAAFSDIVDPLNSGSLYCDIYESYENRDTLEARLVKASDILDLLVQVLALERAGARGLDEFWEVAEKPDFKLDGRAKELVDGLVRSLLTKRSEVVASS
jgi:putative hydrolases of HD superfamily